MANAELEVDATPKKKGKIGFLLGLVLAILVGAGGFYAAFSGLIPSGSETQKNSKDAPSVTLKALSTSSFIPLDPLIVNIRSSSKYQLLRFVGQLQVKPEYQSDVEALKPRLVDVMNTYLNALDAARFEDPIALIKLRSQLLRRIQIVTGDGRVEALLIMEFILQ